MNDSISTKPAEMKNVSDSFRIEKVPQLHAALVRGLNRMPRGHGYCVPTTCDISRFSEFEELCRQKGCRAPWFYAYVARCMGATLQDQTHFIAARYGKKLIVPSFVQIKIAVEATGGDGEKTPILPMFKHLGTRTLPDISGEMKALMRELRRNPVPPPIAQSRFAPAGSPFWWSEGVQNVRRQLPRMRRADAQNLACAQLSSTSQLTKGHQGWGLQLFTACALSVTLGGVYKCAVVVDDEIVIRPCVDMAITFDHDITDGAPATHFTWQLVDEIESGRLLNEHPMTPRKAREKTISPPSDMNA